MMVSTRQATCGGTEFYVPLYDVYSVHVYMNVVVYTHGTYVYYCGDLQRYSTGHVRYLVLYYSTIPMRFSVSSRISPSASGTYYYSSSTIPLIASVAVFLSTLIP